MELTVIVIIIAVAAFYIATHILKKMRLQKLLVSLQSQQFETFDKLIDSKLTKYLFPPFNVEYLKLNSYILRLEEKEIDNCFDRIFKLRMSKAQKEDIYMKAFNYYVGVENKEKTKNIIEVIEQFDNEAMRKEARTIYDIFILKRNNYIEDMEKSLVDADDAEKGVTEYLLSVQYENKGDKKKAKEYLELSKKHLNPEE